MVKPSPEEGYQDKDSSNNKQISYSPVAPSTKASFKRPHTPSPIQPNADSDKSGSSPNPRIQTPLFRTEIKSISKLSDCVIPIIHLGSNQQDLTVTFGSTYVRKPVTRNFKIENLKDSAHVLEANLKQLLESGFSINFEGIGISTSEPLRDCRMASRVSEAQKSCTIEVPPRSTLAVPINWLPTKLGKVRLAVLFTSKTSTRGFRLILDGLVVTPPAIKSQVLSSRANKRPVSAILGSERDSDSSKDSSPATSEKLKRTRQAAGTETESISLGWLKEPNQAFAELLNFTLCPLDFARCARLEVKSPASFSLTWARLFVRGRGLALHNGLAAEFASLRAKIDRREIKLRRKFNILTNIGLRRDLTRLFLQFEPQWLTLGLEVVLGRKGVFRVPFDQQATKDLVTECLFGRLKDGSDQIAEEKCFLEASLKLLVFLDAARKAELIPGHRRLFTSLSEVRSTQAFFGQMKLKFFEKTDACLALSFRQTSRNGANLQVEELSQDLRDGVRLCHLACLLTGDRRALGKLTVPIKTYQASVDNLSLVFDLMGQHGIRATDMVGGPTRPQDIADGDRKKTLSLLWEMGRRWQLPKLVNVGFFSSEIDRLKDRFRRQFGRPLVDGSPGSKGSSKSPMVKLLTWVAAVASFFNVRVTNFTNSFEDGRALCCLISFYFPRLLSPSLILDPPTSEGAILADEKVGSPPKRQKNNTVREAIRHNFDLFKRVVAQLGDMPIFVSFRVDGVINEHIVVLYVAHLAHRIQTLVTQDRCVFIVSRALRQFYFRRRVLPKSLSFHSIRRAAICIQASWRRWAAGKAQQKRPYYTILIQRLYRAKLHRARFLSFQASLRSTQVLCRRLLAQRRLALATVQTHAAIRIQASVRRFLERPKLNRVTNPGQSARKRIVGAQPNNTDSSQNEENVSYLQMACRPNGALHNHTEISPGAAISSPTKDMENQTRNTRLLHATNQAAVRIQSCFRRYLAQIRYSQIKNAAILIQTRRRACILTQINRQAFTATMSSILFVQARFRLVRSLHLQHHKQFNAATVIQSQFRRFFEVRRYQNLRGAALYLQRRRRALVVGTLFRKRYLETQHAIRSLQKLSRRHLFIRTKVPNPVISPPPSFTSPTRINYRNVFAENKSSELFQELLRNQLTIERQADLDNTATFLQGRRRSCLAVRKLLDCFRTTRILIIRVQRAWRHRKLGQSIRHDFTATRDAVSLISQKRRQLIQMRSHRQGFLELKAAATLSQRVHRLYHFGKRVRKEYVQKKRLVTFIQARRRTFVVRSAYHQLRDKVNVICCLRRHAVAARDARVQYAETKKRLIHIQRSFRHKLNGAAIRADYLRSRNAATAIQSFWRMYAQKKAYLQLQQTANLVGTRRRQLVQARDCRYRYMELRWATVTIQQRWRQAQHQKAIHQDFSRLRASTIIIQSHWRRHQLQSRVAQLSRAVQIITRTRRRAVLARQTHCEFALLRTVSIALQKKFRLYRLGRATRAEFTRMRSSAILIQASCRRAIAMRDFSQLRSAATLVAKRYRLALLSTQVRHEYLTLRKAAMFVQAQRRMAVVRTGHLQLCWAASVISQRRIQATLARTTRAEYNSLLASVVLVQQRFRLIQHARLVRKAYTRSRAAAVTIQAQWRMVVATNNYVQLRRAACLFALKRRAAIEARLENQKYLAICKSTINIQRRYRLIQQGKETRRGFKAMQSSAITIQAVWRRATARAEFLWRKWAASIVSCRRRHLLMAREARNDYLDLRTAATLIQARRRMVDERAMFVNLQNAATSVSQRRRALVLTRDAQQTYQVFRRSVIALQSQRRMCAAQTEFLRLRRAANIIAHRRVSIVLARSERQEYRRLRTLAIAIQERHRSTVLTRSIHAEFLQMISSAIKIQATWRSVIARSKFVQLRWAASVVARRWKQTLLSQNARQEYLSLRNVAISLQQRHMLLQYGRTIRASFERKRSAAISIQTFWRSITVRSSFSSLRLTVNSVAQRRRQLMEFRDVHQLYNRVRAAAIFLQKRHRLLKVRERDRVSFKLMQSSAIAIQAQWRYITARSNFLWQRWAANIIAQRRRQKLQAMAIRQRYLRVRETAILLQRRFRLTQVKTTAQVEFVELKAAAISVQAFWRSSHTRANYLNLRNAVNFSAERRRQSLIARSIRQQFLEFRLAIVTAQKIYRDNRVVQRTREWFELATYSVNAIQSYWRGDIVQIKSLQLAWAIRFVVYRRRLLILARETREWFLELRVTTLFVQRTLRNNHLAASERRAYISQKSTAIKLQALWRRADAVKNFRQVQSAAYFTTTLRRQSVLARTTRFEYLQVQAATIAVQQKYRQSVRATAIHREYLGMRSAAITFQAHWKRLVARSNFVWLRWAAQCVGERRKATLQAREEQSRHKMLIQGTVASQRIFRHYRACALVRSQYTTMVKSTVAIQQAIRAYWQHLALKNRCAILIQSHWRGRQSRVGFLMLKQAATFVSACHRARTMQAEFTKYRSLVITLQRRWRHETFGARCQLKFHQLRVASILLQRLYRRKVDFRNQCAIQLQNAWRSWHQRTSLRALVAYKSAIRLKWKAVSSQVLSALILRRHFDKKRLAVSHSKRRILSGCLSTWRTKCRPKLIASREARLAQQRLESSTFLQVACRGYLAKRRLYAAHFIAIRVQSLFRAHLVRRRSHPRVREACRGVMRACREAEPRMCLGNRTTEAIELLSGNCRLIDVIHACEHLVVVTRLSSSCRQRLVGQFHIIQVLLGIMARCDRNQPNYEALCLAVVILENISRDPSCDWGTCATPKEVDILITTMLKHKDLNHIRASLLVTLDYLMSHPVGFQSVLSTPHALTRLYMIQPSTLRHQREPLGNSSTVAHPLPACLVKFSIGLTGLSSRDFFDHNQMLKSMIFKLAAQPI